MRAWSNGFSSRRLRSVLAVSTSAFTQTAAGTIERALAAKSEVRRRIPLNERP